MIHDDGMSNSEPHLPDTDIDAFLDKVDTDYEALSVIDRRRLHRSVQQAQREIAQPDGGVDHLARHLDAAELFPAPAFDIATAKAIAAETISTAKARAAAVINVAEDKAREVEKIALKTLQDAHREADAIRALASAERDKALGDAQQAEQEAAATRERARKVLAQAKHDAAVLRYLATADAIVYGISAAGDLGEVDEPTRTDGSSPAFAQEVRRLRNERGLSLTGMTGLVPYSKGHLSKIENGHVHPNSEMARILDEALQAGGYLVELVEASTRSTPGDHNVLRTYESMLDQHRAMGDRLSPEVVLRGLRPQVDVLSSMAQSARVPGLSRGLWQLAARYAEYAGWMEQERGDDVAAAEFAKHAFECATKGGDIELEARTLIRAAEFTLFKEDANGTAEASRYGSTSPSAAGQPAPVIGETRYGHAAVSAEVVSSAVKGDKSAIEQLLRYLRPLVVKYCRARVGRSATTADDVAQDVCLAVLTALPKYQEQGRPFLAFVYGIAAQKVTDAHRALARTRAELMAEVPAQSLRTGGPEDYDLPHDLNGTMGQLLRLLPAEQREILVLRVVVGLSTEETAEAVGSTPGTVRVAQHRALNRLREELSSVTPDRVTADCM